MARRTELTSPSQATVKRLFAKSGNRCAFPTCTVEIVHKDTIIGQVCHIKAQNPLGPRYDPQQSVTDRHDYQNLILLCANHHLVVDGDPDTYTSEELKRMKDAHEQRTDEIATGESERASALLVGKPSEEPKAETLPPANGLVLDVAERKNLISQAKSNHSERVTLVAADKGAIGTLGGAILVMHIFPASAVDGTYSEAFSQLATAPDLFPPIADRRPRDWKVDFEGLLTGSNNDGLGQSQRAYVRLFKTGIVESVVSSLARGHSHDALMLPQIQAMIVKYSYLYTRALSSAGIEPPYVITCSLARVRGMRLLHDFIGTALVEDMPQTKLNQDRYDFVEAVFDEVPRSVPASARELKKTLDHAANAAGLAKSPYFDASGNYLLEP